MHMIIFVSHYRTILIIIYDTSMRKKTRMLLYACYYKLYHRLIPSEHTYPFCGLEKFTAITNRILRNDID